VPTSAFQGISQSAPDCSYGGEIKSIAAVDENTVKFTLCNPDPAMLSKVAFAVFEILPKSLLDSTAGDSAKISTNPVGTGPYILKEWVRGDHMTFEANPYYWGTAPKTKTVILRWSTESAQRWLELQSGTVSGIDNPSPDDFAAIKANTSFKLIPRDPLNIFYLGLSNTHKPFDNEKVRQAVAMAIDKKHIVDNFYPAGSLVAEQFVPPVMKPGFSDNTPWYTYDVTAAKKLLADAGYPNGFETTLSFRDVVRPYLPNPKQVAQDIQSQLAKIGITVKIVQEESGTFLANTSADKEAMYMLGWGADYPDATDFYDYHFASFKGFGTLYDDIVKEVRAAGQSSDPAARQTAYDQVNTLIKQHVPMVPIAHGVNATAWAANVDGAHSSPLTNEEFSVMSIPGADQIIFMQNAEPLSMWCGDETDGETIRACIQVMEPLMQYETGGVKVVPGLAESYENNTDLTEWTFHLRKGVKFSDGTALTANDVVATYQAMWDAKNPNHKGNTGTFDYFSAFFSQFLNAK
jgi:peptide/nickel transport system substrate-binding protein